MVKYIAFLKNENLEKFKNIKIKENKKIIIPGLSKLGKLNNDINIIFSPFNSVIYFLSDSEWENIKLGKMNKAMKETGLLVSKDIIPEVNENEENLSFAIFPTTSCNLNCKYCYANYGKRDKNLPIELLDKFLHQFINEKTKKIDIVFHGGGEPFCNFDFLKKATKKIKEINKNSSFSIQTNGFFSKEIGKWLVKNIQSLAISYDGLPEIQNYQRPDKLGNKTSSVIENNIKFLVQKKMNPAIAVTISNYSVDKQCQIVYHLHRLGIKKAQLSPLHKTKHMEKYDIETVDLDLYEKEFLKAKELSDEFEMILTSFLFSILGPRLSFCGFSRPQICLTPDGLLTACFESFSADAEKDFSYGIYDEKKGKFILDQNKINEFKKYRPENFKKCRECFLRWVCAGGCPANQYRYEDGIFQPDERICELKRNMAKKYLLSRVEKDFLKMKPCILEENNKLYYQMSFNKFLLKENEFKANPILEITKDTNFKILLMNILNHEKSRYPEPTLFLFKLVSFSRAKQKDFIEFLDKLIESKIFFKMMNPVPFCLFSGLDPSKYKIPKTCFECLKMFKVKNHRVFFCNGASGKKINEYKNRNEIYKDFKKNNIISGDKSCRYKIRKNCYFCGDLVD